jgi:hypothetical protein
MDCSLSIFSVFSLNVPIVGTTTSIIARFNLVNRLPINSGVLLIFDVSLTKSLLEVLVHSQGERNRIHKQQLGLIWR